MNGVHDMGGMHGFGPIERELDEPVFHHDWEAHVRALEGFAVGGGLFNLDALRYGIERMNPADYLRASYYERWLASTEYNLAERGVITADELDAWTERLRHEPEATPQPPAVAPQLPTLVAEPVPDITPRFNVGDAVVARNVNPAHHTRLPRYTRGKRGVIHAVRGPEIFPDTNAHNRGADPQIVYSVRFTARELWGDAAEATATLNIDLWESYLEPA